MLRYYSVPTVFSLFNTIPFLTLTVQQNVHFPIFSMKQFFLNYKILTSLLIIDVNEIVIISKFNVPYIILCIENLFQTFYHTMTNLFNEFKIFPVKTHSRKMDLSYPDRQSTRATSKLFSYAKRPKTDNFFQ